MALSWNEIKDRAFFEHKVKKLDESNGYIDLLWKGTILIEMKSRGKNLYKAYQQAIDYTHVLPDFHLISYTNAGRRVVGIFNPNSCMLRSTIVIGM